MPSFPSSPGITLIGPYLAGAKNRLFPGGRPTTRALVLTVAGLLLGLALYLVSVRVVGYFHRQSEVGIILSLKIFQMAWITLFAMLTFSCTVSAISSIFLSRDNEIVSAAPIRPREIFVARFLSITFYSSWMMVAFSLPVFLAYGRVFGAGITYGALTLLALLATVGIASGLGIVAAIVLIRVFPARQTKQVVLYIAAGFGLVLFFLLRLMQPENLVNPETYPDFVEYLSSISKPTAPFLPPAWAGDALSAYLSYGTVDWLAFGLLVFTAAVIYLVGELAMERWFFTGYSKSQESFGGYRRFSARRPYRPSRFGWVAGIECRVFLRDSSEWSQLLMIGALVAVYLYNFRVLPLDRSFLKEEYLINLLSFLNIGLVGFVITSLCARFVYPSLGSEGDAFVFIRSAPITLGRYLGYKFIFYAVPFLFLALLLVLVSDYLLGVTGPMLWISVATTLIITLTVVALALAFGGAYADFRAENRSAAMGSAGAIFYLFAAALFQLAVIGLGAYPSYRLVITWLRHGILWTSDLVSLIAWVAATVGGAGAISLFAFRKAVASLEQRN